MKAVLSGILLLSGILSKYCVLSGEVISFGLHPSDFPKYDPTIDFTCKDGILTIPYEQVNDDYCDCDDGSDEPATSACGNGAFYCANLDYVGHYVPSSRVNDGLCDCCDGSDEYQTKSCANTCQETKLRVEREAEELEKSRIYIDGFASKYVHTNHRRLFEEEEKRLASENRAMKTRIENYAVEMESKAQTAEHLAYEAIEKEEANQTGKTYKSYEENFIHQTFLELDLNGNGVLELSEIKNERTFDLNKNAQVEDKEIKWFYDAMPAVVDETLFQRKIWKKIGRLYIFEKELDKSLTFQHHWMSSNKKNERSKSKGTGWPGKSSEASESGFNEKDEEKPGVGPLPPIYEKFDFGNLKNVDENTRKLVEDARKTQEQLEQAREKLERIKRNTKSVWETKEEKVEEKHEEDTNFQQTNSQYEGKEDLCAHYVDKIHVYTLCPFHGVFQQDKYKKHKRVGLGRWVGWKTENERPLMLYDNGTLCPNGRPRSTLVKVYCGAKNMIVHVEEPRMCEYVMDLKTPAGCHLNHLTMAGKAFMPHDEF